jgi:hypothetical protein
MDAAEALGPGTAQELHQDGLGLVIQGVRGQDGIGAALGDERGEAVVAKRAGGLFDGLGLAGGAAASDPVWHAGVVDVERDREAQAEGFDEGEVSVRFVTAQAMVDMDGGEPCAQRVTGKSIGGVEQKQQGH